MNISGMIENGIGIGFQTVGIGMLFVLGIIAVLYVVLLVLIPLFSKTATKKTAKATEPTPVAAQTVTVPDANNDEEIIAVITAAISAATNSPIGTFRVVNYKRIK
ncbi:MAG: OadG family protein [Clostridia bacterium]|nr:OadG family protein [Clostridia bacterium]